MYNNIGKRGAVKAAEIIRDTDFYPRKLFFSDNGFLFSFTDSFVPKTKPNKIKPKNNGSFVKEKYHLLKKSLFKGFIKKSNAKKNKTIQMLNKIDTR
jgi:hypothetical protein